MGKRERNVRAIRFLLAAAVMLLSGCGGRSLPPDGGDDLARILAGYPNLPADRAERGTVRRIVDGDTFELESGAKVRLIGVNTPETHGKVQYYGKEAADYTEKILSGRSVILFPDVSDRDKYGRLLRYVFVSGDEMMFNERLVKEGYAQVMTVPPNVAFADSFVRLQKEARSRGAGLWGGEPGNDGKETNAPDDSATAAPPACPYPIKGNVNAKGDKIYHVPGGSSYRNTKPERWFCSEQEAADAGFRKAAK
ncbi:nuclease [Cohnella sp. CFH 77786]|uniref:thermonuclease family protein n=1 Tax=Cohnella sp. CFH 77786 TaxID=2662265 RepID=UPI001C608B05|nr:thermonuclease family protein [Cohnella sp. CFH 77786]MBW5444692.1 nuclease [Cohnella sp. CFH 77786]